MQGWILKKNTGCDWSKANQWHISLLCWILRKQRNGRGTSKSNVQSRAEQGTTCAGLTLRVSFPFIGFKWSGEALAHDPFSCIWGNALVYEKWIPTMHINCKFSTVMLYSSLTLVYVSLIVAKHITLVINLKWGQLKWSLKSWLRKEEVWVEEDSVAETAGAAMKEVERNREFKTEWVIQYIQWRQCSGGRIERTGGVGKKDFWRNGGWLCRWWGRTCLAHGDVVMMRGNNSLGEISNFSSQIFQSRVFIFSL